MRWVLLVLLLLSLPRARAQFGLLPDPFVLAACLQADSPHCHQSLSTILKMQIGMCEAQRTAFKCEEYAKQEAEDPKKLMSCDASAVCRREAFGTLMNARGCGAAFVELGADVKETIEDIWTYAMENAKKETEFLALCDREFSAKKKLAMRAPNLATMSDDKIKEMSANEIYEIVKNYEHMVKFTPDPNRSWEMARRPTDLSEESAEVLEERRLKREMFGELVESKFRQMGLVMGCYTPEIQAQMFCYGVASIVIPGGAAKLALKLKKLGLLAKALEKLGASGKTEKFIPEQQMRMKIDPEGKTVTNEGALSTSANDMMAVRIKNEELKTAVRGNASNSQVQRITDDLSKEMRKELEGKGIKTERIELGDPPRYALKVTSVEGRNPFQELVRNMKEKYGVDVVFDPYTFSQKGQMGASYVKGSKQIRLPAEYLTDGNIDKVNDILLHEVNHASIWSGLPKGKDSPYYMQVTAREGKTVTDIPGYETGFGADELSTYSKEIKQMQSSLDPKNPRTASHDKTAEAFTPGSGNYNLTDPVARRRVVEVRIDHAQKQLQAMAQSTVKSMDQILAEAKSGKLVGTEAKFDFEMNAMKITRKIYDSQTGQVVGEMEFWLPGTTPGMSSAEVKSRYLQYVQQLRETAQSHLKP